MEPNLLRPDTTCLSIEEIGDDTTERTEHDVEETKHCCPSSGTGLAELGEVLEVVGTEDGVDGEFGTEGAEVAEGNDGGLRSEDHGHGFPE